MQPSPESRPKLERAVHQALRELPLRSAPRTLESRVLAELERRAALPWWQKGFAYWPMGARLGFVAVSSAVAIAALWVGAWAMAGFDGAQVHAALAPQFAWVETIATVFRALAGSAQILVRNIPPLWLYGGLAVLAAAYAALFGLGAAAYRLLGTHR
jgi:hypothetical protein